MQQNALHGDNFGNCYSYFSPGYFCLIRFLFYGVLHHIGNMWVSSSTSHSIGKWSKTHQMGKAWKIGTHAFSIAWVLFSIKFPSCGILHHMGNAGVSLPISHCTRKCNKAHRMGRTWEIGTHTFSIVWILFSH